jgi:O-methyltransferase involved in polyketide biosynthesis
MHCSWLSLGSLYYLPLSDQDQSFSNFKSDVGNEQITLSTVKRARNVSTEMRLSRRLLMKNVGHLVENPGIANV